MAERHSDSKVLYQPENKGYGVKITEALCFGVPTIVKELFDSISEFIIDHLFINPNDDVVENILKTDFSADCFKKVMKFVGKNERLSINLMHMH